MGFVSMWGAVSAPGAAARAPVQPFNELPLSAVVTIGSGWDRIPQSFLGLSVEVGELASYMREGAVFDRAVGLLRPASGDPMQLRVAGKSADAAYWKTPVDGAPPWVFELDDQWLDDLASLASRDRLRVTLGLNLAVHSPTEAASLARAASEALAPNELAGFAVGNEPDLFPYQPGLARERIPTTLASTPAQWPQEYSPTQYRRDYEAYAQAVTAAVPGVPLDGPETAESGSKWLGFFHGLGRLTPRSLTVHRYASSNCRPTSSPRYPRISLFLSERSTGGLARRLRRAIRLAHAAHLPLIVSEMNSVSCGGPDGVADSFATALWAPDALFELARVGVGGVFWHIRAHLLNAPFVLAGAGIQPLPEFYGLALFARMLGRDTQLMNASVSTSSDLKVWVTRTQKRTSVLLINKGVFPVRVSLPSRGIGRAELERMLAPSISSSYGVSLGGRTIGTDGRWHGREVAAAIRSRGGRYQVLVPGYSAALVQEVQS